jgi:predicted Fe-S protein YdhL (DUF1289 family)
MTSIPTPCIKICTLDRQSGLCAGCGRDIGEIARWSRMSDDERRRIMTALPERLRLGGRRAQGAD